jgi:hypothetical protein
LRRGVPSAVRSASRPCSRSSGPLRIALKTPIQSASFVRPGVGVLLDHVDGLDLVPPHHHPGQGERGEHPEGTGDIGQRTSRTSPCSPRTMRRRVCTARTAAPALDRSPGRHPGRSEGAMSRLHDDAAPGLEFPNLRTTLRVGTVATLHRWLVRAHASNIVALQRGCPPTRGRPRRPRPATRAARLTRTFRFAAHPRRTPTCPWCDDTILCLLNGRRLAGGGRLRHMIRMVSTRV